MMRKRGAFTLVELLVVIGIIAVLISILLPALNKARGQANKAKCLAGLRSLGQALSIYAAENKDRAPIGFVATQSATSGVDPDQLQFPLANYVWFGNASNGNMRDNGLGYLARARIVTRGPTAFYCPTETRDRLMYDTIDNPWVYKIDKPETYVWGPSGLSLVYISYMCRPVAAWPSLPFNDPKGDNGYLIEGYYPYTAAKGFPRGFPQLSKLKNKAIISELMRTPQDIKVMHKDGINVYYANGSAKFVRLSDFDKAAGSTAAGPFGGGSTAKWSTFTFVGADGRMSAPVDVATNQAYLNSTPKFPTSTSTATTAGVWNWLDVAP